jgi:hypothetical protein
VIKRRRTRCQCGFAFTYANQPTELSYKVQKLRRKAVLAQQERGQVPCCTKRCDVMSIL